MTDHICPKPGCGMKQVRSDYLLLTYPPQEVWICPRNADAHALCKRVAELEAALRLHGSHLGCCAERDSDGVLKCDCGLRMALEGGTP
jgi:hypothetical protein